MVCDEGPPAAVERDGAYVVGLVRERNAGRVQFLEVVLTMPLGLAKRISFYHEQLRTLQLQFTVQHSLTVQWWDLTCSKSPMEKDCW